MIAWFWLIPVFISGMALGLTLARPQSNALRIRLIGKHEAYAELGAHTEVLQRELSKYKMLVASFTEAGRREANHALEKAGRQI